MEGGREGIKFTQNSSKVPEHHSNTPNVCLQEPEGGLGDEGETLGAVRTVWP